MGEVIRMIVSAKDYRDMENYMFIDPEFKRQSKNFFYYKNLKILDKKNEDFIETYDKLYIKRALL